MKVLFVNHSQQQCGVYQFGNRIYNLANESPATIYIYLETESFSEFIANVNYHHPDVILYNWYPVTMGWLSEGWVAEHKEFEHYFLFHDGHVRQTFDKYIFSGAEGKDINFPKEKTAIVPRPLFVYNGDYPENEITTIGSFGFGGWQKGFIELVELVNQQFDKVIINIQMPFAYFGDRFGIETKKIAQACRNVNKNPNITLNIDHTFLSNEDTLKFLAGNDINIFLYHAQNQGLSSVLDYALSVKRPIALSDNSMFKHVFKEDIWIKDRLIIDLIEQGTEPLQEYYDKWNPSNFSKEMDKIYAD